LAISCDVSGLFELLEDFSIHISCSLAECFWIEALAYQKSMRGAPMISVGNLARPAIFE